MRFFHANALGTTQFVTDGTGAALQDQRWYPWGQQWDYAGGIYDLHFASLEQIDPSTGLYPTQFRMYQPRFYRWLSPDPMAGDIMNPQSLNRYAYVLNNPVNFVDPLGLAGECGPGVSNCIPATRHTGLSPGAYIGGSFMPWVRMGYDIFDAIAGRLTDEQAYLARISGPGLYGFTSDGGVYRWVQGGTVHSTIGGVSYDEPTSTAGRWKMVANLGDSLWGSVTTTVRNFLRQVPLAGSVNIPIPPPEGPGGPTVPFALHVPDTNTGCVGGGWWVGTPSERAVGGGPLIFGNLGNARDILSGPSWSANIQLTPWIGFQAIWNSSGVLAGPTAALVPGAAVARTWSKCK